MKVHLLGVVLALTACVQFFSVPYPWLLKFLSELG